MPALLLALKRSAPFLWKLLLKILRHPRFLVSATGQKIIKILEISGYVAVGTSSAVAAWAANRVENTANEMEDSTVPEIILASKDAMIEDVKILEMIILAMFEVGLEIRSLMSQEDLNTPVGKEVLEKMAVYRSAMFGAQQKVIEQATQRRNQEIIMEAKPGRRRVDRSVNPNQAILGPIASASESLNGLDLNRSDHRRVIRDTIRWAIGHYGGIEAMKRAHLYAQAFVELSPSQINVVLEEMI